MTEVSAGMLPQERAIIFPRYKLPETFSRDMVTLAYQSETAILADQLVHFHALDHILVHYDNLLVRTRQANAVRKNYTEIVEAFIREGRRHLCRGSLLRVENLAALIPVSPKTLNRAFALVFGGKITPVVMLVHMRMYEAYRALTKNPETSVQQVAHLLGYNETSAFTKAYRKTLGHLPSEVRRSREKDLPPFPVKHPALTEGDVRNEPPQMSVVN